MRKVLKNISSASILAEIILWFIAIGIIGSLECENIGCGIALQRLLYAAVGIFACHVLRNNI